VIANEQQAPTQRWDYFPFGETIPATLSGRNLVTGYGGASGDPEQFTGKERDAETGLDYFGYRYFSSAQGRWTSPDEPFAGQHPEDPQTWNMYGYGRNNPLRFVDPDGKDIWDTLKGAANAVISDFSLGTNRNTGGNSDFKTGQAIGDAVATVGGALETALGSSGEALGVVLDATGVGAVLGVPLNVAAAGVIAHGATTAVISGVNLTVDATAPNPYGTKGAPDHQQTADEEAAKMGPNGQREVRVPTPGGEKDTRVIDAAKVENGRVTEATQVIRPNKNGTPPAREVRAARDIENATGVKPKLVPVRPCSGGGCNQ
jgi:RHS repeat-associated protein